MNVHAAPQALSPPSLSSVRSRGPPIRAVLPLAERLTLAPNCPPKWLRVDHWSKFCSPPPVSFSPCWVHVAPERVKTHAAPLPLLSPGPPTRTVLPSEDSDTLAPKPAGYPTKQYVSGKRGLSSVSQWLSC